MNKTPQQTVEKYSLDILFDKVNTQKDAILRVAKEVTGLNFKYVTLAKGNSGISISCDGTDDDLGFYGNYISAVSYYLRIGAAPSAKNAGKLWASSGISYTHKRGGSNGVSDTEKIVFYDWNTKQFIVEEVEQN